MNRRYSLKKQHIIVRLLKKKKTIGTSNYILYFKETTDELKIAISVSKKIGNAVERNYEKRVCREIISKRAKDMYGYAVVFVVKPSAVELKFDKKEAQINYLINKMINKKGEKNE